MSKETVLVTGGAGFIGSHLVELLVERNYHVKVLDQYNARNSRGWLDDVSQDIVNNIEYIPGDIRDIDLVKNSMKGCQKIFHLAALIAIPYSYISPRSYIETNVTGTLNVLQAARDLSVDRVIHTSTSEVYGSAQYVPINESHPLEAQSPYAASKTAADQLALSFNRSFDSRVAILRPFNTYGPRQSFRAVIPTVIEQFLKGKKEINLGNTFPTRDFSYVGDTARAFLEISNCEQAIGKVVNVGSNFEISIAALVKEIADLLGVSDYEIKSDGQRNRKHSSEVDRLYSCTKLAQELWGLKPTYGGLDGFRNGLANTIAWFQRKTEKKTNQHVEYTV